MAAPNSACAATSRLTTPRPANRPGASTPRPIRPKQPDNAASDKVCDGRSGNATWDDKGEWIEAGGGGTAWDAIAYDPELDILYIGVGNGSPWNQRLRSPSGGDNLFLSSIVALKPDTGEYVWHYQTTPGETWDYTATQPIMLADLEIDGAKREGADAGAEERLLLRARPRDRRS